LPLLQRMMNNFVPFGPMGFVMNKTLIIIGYPLNSYEHWYITANAWALPEKPV